MGWVAGRLRVWVRPSGTGTGTGTGSGAWMVSGWRSALWGQPARITRATAIGNLRSDIAERVSLADQTPPARRAIPLGCSARAMSPYASYIVETFLTLLAVCVLA